MGSFFIGAMLGALIAVPELLMVRTYQKDKVFLSAIFLHWVVIGGLMPFIDLEISTWLTGILIGVLTTLPMIVIDIRKSKNAVIHTSVFAPIWGITLAYLCANFA